MESALHRSWRKDQRKGAFPAQDRARGVDGLHPGEHIWHKIDVCIAIGVARFGQLVICRAVDIVEHGEGQPRLG